MRSRRWWNGGFAAITAPAVVVVVIAAIALTDHGMASARASTAPALPAKSAGQVLALLRGALTTPVHGTVVERTALGVPSLPSGLTDNAPSGLPGLLGLVTGTHTLRVWADDGKLRAQVLGQLDETDLVATSTDLWTFTYSTNEVTRLPMRSVGEAASVLVPGLATQHLLSAMDASTSVEVSSTAKVAGRDTYVLDVVPGTAATTIGRIAVAVDAATGVPLRVRVYARNATSPAFSLGFTTVSFSPIAASVFSFTPPPHASVSTTGQSSGKVPADVPRTIGKGWSTILVVPPASHQSGGSLSLIAQMGQPVGGGILVSSALVNLLVTDGGELLVGAVPASALVAATKTTAQ